MKHITVEIKDQYGNQVFYPACEDADAYKPEESEE